MLASLIRMASARARLLLWAGALALAFPSPDHAQSLPYPLPIERSFTLLAALDRPQGIEAALPPSAIFRPRAGCKATPALWLQLSPHCIPRYGTSLSLGFFSLPTSPTNGHQPFRFRWAQFGITSSQAPTRPARPGRVETAPYALATAANAGQPATVPIGSTVLLDGTRSTSVTGQGLSFTWTFLSVPQGSTASFLDARAAQTTFTADQPGNYVVQLTVNDGVSDATTQVVISTLNSAPTANAGPAQKAVVDSVVKLDGSGSTDPDGDKLSYHWTFLSLPNGSQAQLSDPSSVTPTFTVDVAGDYVAQLSVSDGFQSSNATVTISTNNLPPVANAGVDQSTPVGVPVQLDGSASPDPENGSLHFLWSFTFRPQGSSAVLLNPDTASPQFTPDVPGVYALQLTVTDDAGRSSTATVTVNTGDTRPVAVAGNAQSLPRSSHVSLNGSSSFDANNDPLEYTWALLATPSGSQAVLSSAMSATPTFTVDVEGDYVAQLIVSDGTWRSVPSTVLITATAGQAHIDPQVIDFGTQTLQLTSSSKQVTVSNTGTAPLTINSLSLTGSSATEFSVTSPALPATVAPGGNSAVNVTFSPHSSGARTATLLIANDASPSTSVTLTGTGVDPPLLTYNPGIIAFGNQLKGQTTAATTVYVGNFGSGPLTISNLVLAGSNPGDFAFSADTLPITVNKSTTTQIAVTFTPTATGLRSAFIWMTDNATGSPHMITLSGTGIAPAVTFNPNTISFPDTAPGKSSNSVPLTVTNSGTAALTIKGVTFTGDNSSDFSLIGAAFPISLNPNAKVNLGVVFTPSVVGPRTATMTLNSNADNAPNLVALSGNGTSDSSGALSPSAPSLAFGSVGTEVAKQLSVQLTNNGSSSLMIQSVALNGANSADFMVTSPTLPLNVPSTSSITLNVTFTPSAPGARNSAVVVPYNATGSPLTIPLSGTGVPPTFSAPSSLDFGSQDLNKTTDPKNLLITNSGAGLLKISAVAITGTAAADFSATLPGPLPVTVQPNGGTATIPISFTPSIAGTRSAIVTITDNASGSPHTVPLSGLGTPPQPQIKVDPASLPFPSTVVGATSAPLTITISNPGTADLQVTAITLSGANAGDFAFSPTTLPITVASKGSTTLSVTFTPVASSSSSRSAALNIASNAGSPQTVTLSGTTPSSSRFTVSPTALDFGSVKTAATASKSVSLSNQGGSNIVISSLTVTGTNASDFTISAAPLPLTLAPGGLTVINVTFKPGEKGSRSATLTIVSNATSSPDSVALTGKGQGTPVFSASTGTLDLGKQNVNSTSAPQTLTLTNTGDDDLAISSITTSGFNATEFAFSSPTLPLTIGAGKSADIPITFTPVGNGTRSAIMRFVDNASGSPHAVNLTGIGTTPMLTLQPDPTPALNFKNVEKGKSSTQTIAMSNTGTGPLTITALNLTGTNSAEYSWSIGTLPITVAPQASSPLTVTFTPSATGTRTAILGITSNSPGSPRAVTLTGSGYINGPDLVPPPASIDFGNQPLNTTTPAKAITLTNDGNADLTITQIAVTGANSSDFNFSSTTLPMKIPAGSSATIQVAFTASAAGARNASLVITHNAPGSPASISLTGAGLAPICTVTPNSLDFGSNQPQGTTSAPQLITISSTGTAPCLLSTATLSDQQNFSVSVPGNLPISIASGKNLQLSVTFTPQAVTQYTAHVSLAHNAPGSPAVVALKGTGTPPTLFSVSPTAVTFPQQPVNSPSAPAKISITNLDGTRSVSITALSITGSNASEFSVSSSPLPITVGPSSTTNVFATFTPSQTGVRTANLSISETADPSPRMVSLSGTGYVDGAAIVLPTALDFGKQLQATNAVLPIMVGNSGTKDLVITSMAIQGDPDFTLAAVSLPITVPPSGSHLINVSFTPNAHGARSAALVFADNSILPLGPQTIPLTGFGTQPIISFTPSSLDFGNQQVSQTSSPLTLTIGNTGDGNLIITGLVNSSPTVFPNIAPVLPITVAPGANATLSVRFAPTQEGVTSATLTFTDSASGSPHLVNLTGNGTVPKMSLPTSPFDFGSQLTQVTSPAVGIPISNPGTAPLVITALSITGTNASDFTIVNNSLPITIAPNNGTGTVNLSFKPGGTGARTANLVFTGNVAGSPQTLLLTGTGLVAPPIITPTSLPFGDQLTSYTTAPMTITATNGSPTLNLIITSATISGANAGEFNVSVPALPFAIAPQTTAQFTVTFTPQTIANNKTATLTFTDNFAGNPPTTQPVALSGNGVQQPLTFSPNPVTFNTPQPVNKPSSPMTVTLINNSGKAITVSNIALSGSNPGDFSVTSGTLPFTIPAGGGIVPLTVTFTPSAVGARSANLVVTDNALGSPHSVAVSGTGLGVPIAKLDNATIDFGPQLPQHVSSPTSLTISNVGTADLHISTLSIAPTGEFALSPAPQLPIKVVPNDHTTLSLVFTPSTTGARSATLSIADDALDSPQVANLKGTGAQACANFSTKTVSFPDQQVNTSSSPFTVTVTNPCPADLILTNLSLTGANPDSFNFTSGPLPIHVPTNASTNIYLTFAPAGNSTLNATLSVVDNASDSPQTITLSGKGVVPVMTLNPMIDSNHPLFLGTMSVNKTSAVSTIQIADTGTGPLTITGIALSGANAGDFSVSAPSLPVTLTPNGAPATIGVSFTPSDVGARIANLVLASNASDSPRSVPLTGTGQRVAITSLLPSTSVNFPDQEVGQPSTPLVVMLSNAGSSDLIVSAINLTGTQASDFSVSTLNLPLTLKPNDPAISIPVTFAPVPPASQKARTANLVVTSNAQNSPTSVTLNGNAVGHAVISLPSSPFDFGLVLQSTAGPSTLLPVGNIGTDNLIISSVAVSGPNAGDFSLTPINTPAVIAPKGSTNLTLRFTPGASGPRTANLTFTDNASGSPHVVTLTGQGTYRAISSNPSGTLDFGNQPAGTTSAPTNLVITNSGTADLTLQSYSVTGTNAAEFKLSGASFPLTIPANAQPVTLQLTFAPTSAPTGVGVRTATLALMHNAPRSPLLLTLQGTGTQPVVTIPQPNFTFGNQVVNTTSNSMTAQIQNTGGAPLIITNLMTDGTNKGDFAFTASPLPITVAPGDQTPISITFTPKDVGTRSAIVRISDNATGSPHALNLTGTGTKSDVKLNYLPANFTGGFGNQLVNTSSSPVTITITNSGTADLHISSFALAGTNPEQFSLTSPATPLVVPTLQNTTLTVVFSPTVKGSASAVLQINDDATPGQQVVNLSGTGTAPVFSSDQASLAFGPRLMGVPASLSLNLSNKGDGNLLLNNLVISGPNASDFTLGTLSLPVTIGASLGTPIPVTFNPSAKGLRSATLTITDNAAGSPHTFALSGTGTQPVITFNGNPTPTPLTFGSQFVGTSSATQPIAIGNSGDGDLIITAITRDGTNGSDFVIANGTTPITIHPNGTPYTLNVAFAPGSGTPGSRSATLTLQNNAPGSPHSIALSGTATQSKITFNGSATPPTLDFGTHDNGTTTPLTLTVGNSGNGDLQITSAGISGSNSGDFAVTAPGSYPIMIPANGQPVTFTVKFTPSDNSTRSANLVFNDNTPGSPQTVPLTGVGQGPVAKITPNPTDPPPSNVLDFGTVTLGNTSATKYVNIANTGNVPLQVSSLSLSGANAGDFVLQGPSVPFTVQPNGSQPISMVFRPTANNTTSTATLNIVDNAPGSPHTALLTGMSGICYLTFPQAISVGRNLEVLGTVGLTCSLRNTISVTVTSDNPSLVLLSSDTTGVSAGGNSVTVSIAGGTTAAFPGFYVQALGGTGSATLTATSANMDSTSVPVTVLASGFQLAGPNGVGAKFDATAGSSDTPLTVTAVSLDSSNKPLTTMRVRGGLNVAVPITSSSQAVGTIVDTATGKISIDSITVPGGQTSSSGASFHPLAAGQSTLTAQTPTGFTPLAPGYYQVVANVSAPAITLNSVTVGNHFEVLTQGTLSAPAPQTGLAVTINSPAPGVALLSTSATAAGSSSIILNVPAGSSNIPPFYVYGMSLGSTVLQVTANGYSQAACGVPPNPCPGAVAVVPSGFLISAGNGVGQDLATTTASSNTQLTVVAERLDNSGNPLSTGIVQGGLTVNVKVKSSNTSVGTIQNDTVVFTGGKSIVSTAYFHPVGRGTTTLSLDSSTTPGFTNPSSGDTLNVTVTQPQIVFSLPSMNVGVNLQLDGGAKLTAPAPSGGLAVHISSNNPQVVLSADPALAGSSSVDLTVPAFNGVDGVGFPPFYVQVLDGTWGGTATLTASAPGYENATVTLNITPSAFTLTSSNGLGQDFGINSKLQTSSVLTISAQQLSIGLVPQQVQSVRGGLSFAVTINSSLPAVGVIRESPVPFSGGIRSQTIHFDWVTQKDTTKLSVVPPSGFSTALPGGSLNATVN